MQNRIILAIVFAVSAFLSSGIAQDKDSKAQDTDQITVKGRVVDDSGSGIQGVHFSFPKKLVTNMNGEYELKSNRNRTLPLQLGKLPDGYGRPLDRRDHVNIPRDAKDLYQLKDIVLRTGAPVSGVVVDEDGNPIEGASVFAGWEIRDRSTIHRAGQSVSCDAKGKFVIGKAPKEQIHIYAHVDDMASLKPLIIEKDEDRSDVRLVISDAGTMRLKGKISDPEGQPIANANIKVILSLIHISEPTRPY